MKKLYFIAALLVMTATASAQSFEKVDFTKSGFGVIPREFSYDGNLYLTTSDKGEDGQSF